MKRGQTKKYKNIEESLPQIREDYIINGFTQQELAKKYEISRATINKYSMQEGWLQQRKDYIHKTTNGILESQMELKIEEYVDRNKCHLNLWGVIFNKLAELIPNAKTLSSLERAAGILTSIQKGERLCLGLDKQEAVTMTQVTEAIDKYNEMIKTQPDDISSLFEEDDWNEDNNSEI